MSSKVGSPQILMGPFLVPDPVIFNILGALV